jgi:hypothetical protein
MDIITSINKEATKDNNPISSIINKQQPQLSTIVNPKTIGVGNGYISLDKTPTQTATSGLIVQEELSPIEKILGRKTNTVQQSADLFNPFAPVSNTVSLAPLSATEYLNRPQQSYGLMNNVGILNNTIGFSNPMQNSIYSGLQQNIRL